MKKLFLLMLMFTPLHLLADDRAAIKRAALDYIHSQHIPNKEQMARSLHPELKKRTYWHDKRGAEFLMETDFETMLNIAEKYNIDGDKFPSPPRAEVEILDVDQRVASVKLIADDWIDYMHLIKDEQGNWKIVNVLWQYHDVSRH